MKIDSIPASSLERRLHSLLRQKAARRLIILWLGMFVAFGPPSFLLVHSAAPAVPSATPPAKPLVVGCELSYPPFSLTKPDQSPDGFTVDLWNVVAREAGLVFEYKVAPFHEVLEGFKADRIQVMINLAMSEPRKQFADFSVPHVTMYGAIFVRKGDRRIKTDRDLEGKRLIVLNRDLAHDYALSRGWTNLALVDDTLSGMKLLSQGQNDAMLVGKLVGLNELRENGIRNVEPVDHRLEFFQKFSFCVRKGVPGNTELLARINEGLALAKANGSYDAIYEKWFGILEPKRLSLALILKYLIPAAILLVLVSSAYVFERNLRLRLKQSVSTLNATLESTADGILVVDQSGKLVNFNRNFLELWGLKQEQLDAAQSGSIFRLVSKQLESPDAFLERVSKLDEQSPQTSFELLRLIDGRCFEWFTKTQFIDGKSARRVWSFRDVSERERAAQQIRRFNQELEERVRERTNLLEIASRDLERLSYVASRTSNAVIIADPSGRIEWVNSGFERVTGWSKSEVLGKKPGHVLQGTDTDPVAVEKMRHAISSRLPIHTELLNYRKDGKPYWIEAEICPVFDRQGEVINFIAIESDITERRLADQELRRQREELAILNVNLEKALRSRDEFLAAMSHELRTPLNGILTLSELLCEQAYGPVNERQREYLSQISESGQHLLELINDILDLVKLEAGSLMLEINSCEVAFVCESTLRSVRPAAAKKEQKVSLIVDPPDLRIEADNRRLKQVLVNLLGNAIKFTGNSGEITLKVSATDGEARFDVTDTGIGIAPEKFGLLFKPFVQLDGGLARKYNGSGLGLALVRRFVELHGGRVEVRSAPGQGSTFTAILPRKAAAIPRTQVPRPLYSESLATPVV